MLNKPSLTMKAILLFALISFASLNLSAQSQAETYIKEAQDFLAQKNYKQAQMSLQDAINDLSLILATQIAESLPDEVNGLKSTGDESADAGAMGMMGGGMTIQKNYAHPTKRENTVELMIIANSPMMAAMNMYINNPAMLGQGYKSVRVGSRRAILKNEMEDFYDDNGTSKQIRSTVLQIPLSQTLITINMKGFATEAEELAFANKLDIEKLRIALGE